MSNPNLYNQAKTDSSSSSLGAERVVEDARRQHMAFNVAVKRLGFSVPACDGPDCHVCRALLALQEAAPSAQWQPIETHDGSYEPVLVAEATGVVEAYYSAEHDTWWELNSVDDGAPGSDRRCYPTHWMPFCLLLRRASNRNRSKGHQTRIVMSDTWRPVVGWEGFYEVSDTGQVRSLPRVTRRRDGTVQTWAGRMLSWVQGSTGYPQVRLRDTVNGRSATPKVHRLVALAFLGPQPPGREVNHRDGDKRNPSVGNLEWVTSRENRKHAWDTGLRDRSDLPIKRGESHPSAKLTEATVAEARRRYQAGEPIRKIACEYGVNKKTMTAALKGITWSGVLPSPPAQEGSPR